jgi:hypothetical protein
MTFDGQQMTIDEARRKMDSNIADKLAAFHPHWNANQQTADAFVTA